MLLNSLTAIRNDSQAMSGLMLSYFLFLLHIFFYLLKYTFEKRRFSAVHSDGIIYPEFSHSAPGGALDDTDAQ